MKIRMTIFRKTRLKMLVALGVFAVAGAASAAESHKNMCTGIVSDGNGKLANGGMIMHWSLTNIQIHTGETTTDFPVSAVRGKMGETNMVIVAEGIDGKVHFTMPLDGMEKHSIPDTITVKFTDGTNFTGACVPIK